MLEHQTSSLPSSWQQAASFRLACRFLLMALFCKGWSGLLLLLSAGSQHKQVTVFLLQLQTTTTYPIELLMLAAIWFLWRTATHGWEEVVGLFWFAAQLISSILLLWLVSSTWLEYASLGSIPSWLIRFGYPVAVGFQWLTLVGFCIFVLLRTSAFSRSSFGFWWGFLLLCLCVARLIWTIVAVLQRGEFTPGHPVTLLAWLDMVLFVGLFVFFALVSFANPTQTVPSDETNKLHFRVFLDLRVLYVLLALLLLFRVLQISGVLVSRWGQLWKLHAAVVSITPWLGGLLSLLLLFWFVRLAHTAKKLGMSRWFLYTAGSVGLLLVLEGVMLWSQFQAHINTPMGQVFATVSSGMLYLWAGSAVLGLLGVLFFLTALRDTALQYQAPALARKTGNLRWIILGYSFFAPLPFVLFISLATHRTLTLKGGAGSIIPYFVALCYLVATVSLLSLVFLNLTGTIRTVQQHLLDSNSVRRDP